MQQSDNESDVRLNVTLLLLHVRLETDVSHQSFCMCMSCQQYDTSSRFQDSPAKTPT